jgi:hypothetical protein
LDLELLLPETVDVEAVNEENRNSMNQMKDSGVVLKLWSR